MSEKGSETDIELRRLNDAECQKQTEVFRDLNRWRFDHSLSLFVP